MTFYDKWASLQIIYSLYYGHSLVVCMTQLLAKELTGFSLPDKHMNEEYPYVEQNCRYNYCYCSPSPISGFLEGDVIDRQDIWATISQREKQDGTQLIRSVIQVTVKNERFIGIPTFLVSGKNCASHFIDSHFVHCAHFSKEKGLER